MAVLTGAENLAPVVFDPRTVQPVESALDRVYFSYILAKAVQTGGGSEAGTN